MEDKPRECIEIVFALVEPICLFEMGEEIVKRYLPIYQETSVITSVDFIIRYIRLGNITNDRFENIVNSNQSQYTSIFIYDKTRMDPGFLEFLEYLIRRIIFR